MIWLWLLVLAFLVAEFAFVAIETAFFSTVALAAFVLLLELTTQVEPITWTVNNLGWAILLFILYFATGAAWSVFRWMIFVHDKAVYYKEYNTSSRPVKPEIGNFKTLLYVWIAYWPFSVLWFFISDPVVRLVKFIYTNLVTVYSNVTNWVWDKNFPVKNKKDVDSTT